MAEQGTELVVRSNRNPVGGTKTGGVASALWLFVKPTKKVAIEPAARGVRYTREHRRGVAPLCDIYRPQNVDGDMAPSVLLVHGGGFMVGSRGMRPIRYVAARLAQAGIGVCSVDYRLLFRGGRISQALEDVNAAADYWHEHAAEYGCRGPMSLMGLSAGATLALLHASMTEHRYSALVNTYGVTDFTAIRGLRAEFVMGLLHRSRNREDWKTLSPMFRRPIEMPILNLHGTGDAMVPVEHSIRFHEARLELGLPSELELYEGAPHGWLNDTQRPESEPSLKLATQFLLRYV